MKTPVHRIRSGDVASPFVVGKPIISASFFITLPSFGHAPKIGGEFWKHFMSYYEEKDLDRFDEIGEHAPELFEKFMAWYKACQEEGALSKREKALIGLAVSVTIQCPYCIDAYTQSSLENGSNMEQMTEAMHLASAIRGGASLIHGVQSHNAHDKISM